MTNHLTSAPHAPHAPHASHASHAPHALSDSELLGRLQQLVARERGATALLIAHLAELDARRLHLGVGCASTHAYCVQVLHLSEHAAYLRIEAARLARRFPLLLDELASGRLHLTGLARLGPHLTAENLADALAAVRHRTRREIEEYVERIRTTPPRPAPARMELRAVPGRSAAGGAALHGAAPHAAAVGGAALHGEAPQSHHGHGAPTQGAARIVGAGASPAPSSDTRSGGGLFAAAGASGPGRPESPALRTSFEVAPAEAVASAAAVSPDEAAYRLHVTIRPATRAKLERARALLGHTRSADDVGEVLDRALDLLVERLERRKWARTTRCTEPVDSSASDPTPPAVSDVSGPIMPVVAPRGTAAPQGPSRPARSIPAPVRRAVHERDRGRCAFVAAAGRRCSATSRLEFHHVVPWARGGPATVDNIELRCRAHNQYQAARDFGAIPRGVRAGAPARKAPPSRPNYLSRPADTPPPGVATPAPANSVWTEFAPG